MSSPVIYDDDGTWAPAALLSATRTVSTLLVGGDDGGDPAVVPGAHVRVGDLWMSTYVSGVAGYGTGPYGTTPYGA